MSDFKDDVGTLNDQLSLLIAGKPSVVVATSLCDALVGSICLMANNRAHAEALILQLAVDLRENVRANWDHYQQFRQRPGFREGRS